MEFKTCPRVVTSYQLLVVGDGSIVTSWSSCIRRILIILGFLVLSIKLLVFSSTVSAQETVYFVHSDHLGSTNITTNEAGEVVSQQVYYPYGTTRATDGLDATERQYTGQVSDVEQTGLYYYNARYYNPLIAKFTQADSQGDTQNKYSYVANNPIIFIDPTGNRLDPGGDVGDIMGGVLLKSGSNVGLKKDIAATSIRSPADYAGDPLLGEEYSTWRNLVAGSPCTACHVSHDMLNSSIPTNDQIDSNLVSYYRSLDENVALYHLAGLTVAANYANYAIQAIELADVNIYWKGQYRTALNSVSKDLTAKGESVTLIGNSKHFEAQGLSSARGTYQQGVGIKMRATGNFKQMTETLHHEYLHFLESRTWQNVYGLTHSEIAATYSQSEYFVYGQMAQQPYVSPEEASFSQSWFNYFENQLKYSTSPLQTWQGYVGPH